MDKNLLYEAEKKRFQQILEFTMPGNKYKNGSVIVDEADNDQAQPQDDAPAPEGDDMNAMPPMDGAMTGPDAGAGATPMGGEQGPDMGMDQNAGGAMPTADGAAPGGEGQGQTPEGFNPQEEPGDMGQGDITPDDFAGGSDDDVVDVTELTDAQEETEEVVKHMGAKFEKAFDYLKQWEDKIKHTEALIKANNEKIDDLKAEFEKRNPTQVEKLSMQTAKSGPFNVTPEEYWDEKEATSNYSTEDDHNGVGQEQYTITKNDIDGTTDWKSIADTLDDDMIYHPTLKNTMGNW